MHNPLLLFQRYNKFPAPTAFGMARVIVPAASVKYVNVNPEVLPVVTAAVVRSTVAGEHTAAGALVTTVGAAFTVTVTATGAEAHPAAVVPTI